MRPAVVETVLLALVTLSAGALEAEKNSTISRTGPLKLSRIPKLDRAHKTKLLVEIACEIYCKTAVWQIKLSTETAWRKVDAQIHSSFPDTFYIRGLQSDTLYHLRALLRPTILTPPYDGDDVPVLEARTCPDRPPPVQTLTIGSAGPGWLDMRWQPPEKEQCKSHLFYQLRYAPEGEYFSSWFNFGYIRTASWVHFRPSHPCAVWPQQFCALVTDTVKPGEVHIVEVRVSRFDEVVPCVSESRRLAVRAEVACITTDGCGGIGGAPAGITNATSNATANATTINPNVTRSTPTDDVDLRAETATATAWTTPEFDDVAEASENPRGAPPPSARRYKSRAETGDSSFGRLSPFFLAMLLLTIAALPAAFVYGRRRGARDASETTRLACWRRDSVEGCSQPVLAECGGEEADNTGPGTFSWTKLTT